MSRRFAAMLVGFVAVGIAAVWGPSPTGEGTSSASPSPVPAVSPGAEATASASPDLTLGVSNVAATLTPDGSGVLSVRLTARLHATGVIDVEGTPGAPSLRFLLVPGRSLGAVATFRSPPATHLGAGSTTTFDLGFDFRGLSVVPEPAAGMALTAAAPAPGVWLLTLDLVDDVGVRHHVETPVTVRASA